MAAADNANRTDVRLNTLDWEILEVMSDCRRYTQQYLYDDVGELEEHSADWVRQRISHLHDVGLIQKVGTSAMYEISNAGLAALEYREQMGTDEPGADFAQTVFQRAEQVDRDDWIRRSLIEG